MSVVTFILLILYFVIITQSYYFSSQRISPQRITCRLHFANSNRVAEIRLLLR